MRLTGRRESNNVEDRRGMGMGAKAGIGGKQCPITGIPRTDNFINQRAPTAVYGGGRETSRLLKTDSGRYRRCMERTVPAARNEVPIPHPRPLHGCCPDRMRQWVCSNGTILLLG